MKTAQPYATEIMRVVALSYVCIDTLYVCTYARAMMQKDL